MGKKLTKKIAAKNAKKNGSIDDLAIMRLSTAVLDLTKDGRELFVKGGETDYYSKKDFPIGEHPLFIPFAYTIRVLTALAVLPAQGRVEYKRDLEEIFTYRLSHLDKDLADLDYNLAIPRWMLRLLAFFSAAISTKENYGRSALRHLLCCYNSEQYFDTYAGLLLYMNVLLFNNDKKMAEFMEHICLNKAGCHTQLTYTLKTPAACLPCALITANSTNMKTNSDSVDKLAMSYYAYCKEFPFSAKTAFPLIDSVADWEPRVLITYLMPMGYSVNTPISMLKEERNACARYMDRTLGAYLMQPDIAIGALHNVTNEAMLTDERAQHSDIIQDKDSEIRQLQKDLQRAVREKTTLETQVSSLEQQLLVHKGSTPTDTVPLAAHNNLRAELATSKSQVELLNTKNAKLVTHSQVIETRLSKANREVEQLRPLGEKVEQLEDEIKLLRWRLEHTTEVDIATYSAKLTEAEWKLLKSIRIAFFLSDLPALHELEALLPNSHFCYVRKNGAGAYISAGTNCEAFVCCASHMGHKQFFRWDNAVRSQGFTTKVTNSTNRNVILRLALDSYRECKKS